MRVSFAERTSSSSPEGRRPAFTADSKHSRLPPLRRQDHAASMCRPSQECRRLGSSRCSTSEHFLPVGPT